MIQTINGKLGRMRKSQRWVIYPSQSADQSWRIIQCDRYIAKVYLESGKTILSDGKGGHPGFYKLSPALGAKEVECCPYMLAQLCSSVEQVGAIEILG